MNGRTNFKPKIGLNDDPLFYLMEMTYIRQLKANKPLQMLLLIPHAWFCYVTILGWHRLIFNFKDNQNFFANLAFLAQGVCATSIIWLLRNFILDYRNVIRMNFWSLHSAGDELYGRIANECKFVIKKTAYFVLCITWISALTQIYYNGNEFNWQFSTNILFKWPKFIGIPMIIMTESVCFIWGQIFSIPTTVLLFNTLCLTSILRLCQRKWVINSSLRQCVLIHTNILRSTKITMKWFPIFTIGLILFALTSFVAPAYFIYAKISPVDNVRMYIILITCIIQECICCVYCQYMEDESLKIFSNAYNCPWNDWDSRNRKFLVMIMVNSMKPIQTSRYGLPNGNYELILKLWRTGHTILALFSNTTIKDI